MKIRSVVCRLVIAGLSVLPFTLHATDAEAAGKKIALTTFSGWKANEVRDWVKSAIDDDFTVTDAEGFKPGKDARAFAKLANELGVDAILVGKQLKGRMAFTLRGRDGAVIKEFEVEAKRGPKLQAAIEKTVPETLIAALGKSASSAAASTSESEKAPPPAKEEEEPEASDSSSSEDAEKSEESSGEDSESEDSEDESSEGSDDASTEGAVAPPIVLDVGVRFQNRSLTYNDTLPQLSDKPLPNNANVLQDHSLGLQPVIVVGLGLYPGAWFGPGFMSNLGLIGGFEYGVPIKSKYTGSRFGIPPELTNKTHEFYVGPRARIPGASSEFGFSVVYGQHAFELAGDKDDNALIPDTKYSYVRIGADAWFSFGKLFAGAELGGLLLTSTGKLGDKRYWFENAHGFGLDAGLRLGYEIAPLLSVVLGGNITRYGLDFNPVPKTASRVAGGAVDQYISGFVGVRFAFGSGGSRGFGLNTADAGSPAPAAEASEESSGSGDSGSEDSGDDAAEEESSEADSDESDEE